MRDDTGTEDRGQHLEVLLANHRAFLSYLERRVGDRALAEDLLQDAFARNLERVEMLPEESLLPWFYRTLRNATIDHYRRRASAGRALEAFSYELATHVEPLPDATAEICACISRLAGTLKPEYAEVLQYVDVEGESLVAFAERKGLTAGNAGVRVHRARRALHKRLIQSCGTCADHGCLDCSCGLSRATV